MRPRKKSDTELTTREKLLGIFIILLLSGGFSIMTMNNYINAQANRYYINVESPDIQKLKVYWGVYTSPSSLTKRVNLVYRMYNIY